MMRNLFLILWVIGPLSSQAHAAIEIYANGHQYNSMQKYLAMEKAAAAKAASTPGALNSQQEDYIRKAAKKLGVDVDFSKIKTFQLGPSNISDNTRHRLYVLSIENGVIGALEDFYQGRQQSGLPMPHRIFLAQLQEAIRKAVTTSKEPKLLISEPGKVRIMAISPDYPQK